MNGYYCIIATYSIGQFNNQLETISLECASKDQKCQGKAMDTKFQGIRAIRSKQSPSV